MTPSQVSEAIALFLGEIAGEIIREIMPRGVMLTGGDAAIKTVQALNATGLVIEDEIQPGIPYGYFTDDQYSNITVVTKAGGFGTEDTIMQVLNFLKHKKQK
jgi:uncharacterized protein YgbK (DUF1537 family)